MKTAEANYYKYKEYEWKLLIKTHLHKDASAIVHLQYKIAQAYHNLQELFLFYGASILNLRICTN